MLLWWLWNAWESWGWLHWIWFTHLLKRFMDDSWSGFFEISLYSFIFFRALFLLLSLFLDIRPWYASIFSSLPERDPRKSGVVVMAAKLTSSASPYLSFIYPLLSLGRHTHFLTQAYGNQVSSTSPLTWGLPGAFYPSLFRISIKTTHPSLHIHTTHVYPSCYS